MLTSPNPTSNLTDVIHLNSINKEHINPIVQKTIKYNEKYKDDARTSSKAGVEVHRHDNRQHEEVVEEIEISGITAADKYRVG